MAKATNKKQAVEKDLPGQAIDLEAEHKDKEPGVTENSPEGADMIPETATDLILKYGNKSKAIRALNAEGKTRSEIAKLLGIRYQHVNNVLNQVLKREIKAERDAKNGNNHNGNGKTQ